MTVPQTPNATDIATAQSPRSVRRLVIPEAVLLGSIPLAGYLFVYSHLTGYAQYFGIPHYLIDLRTSELVYSSVGVALTATAALCIAFMIPPRLIKGIFMLGLSLGIMAAGLYVGGLIMWFSLGVGVLALVVTVCGMWDLGALSRTVHKVNNAITTTAMSDAARLLGIRMRTAKTLLILSIGASAGAIALQEFGRLQAGRWTEFLVGNTSPPCVVLLRSGDNFVCAPFDSRAKRVRQRFWIVPITDTTKTWTMTEVGPLVSTGF